MLASDAASLLSSEQRGAKRKFIYTIYFLNRTEEHILRGLKVLNVVYLCNECFPAVSLHGHGEVEPRPGVVVVLQTGKNQVQVLPVHTTLLSLQTGEFIEARNKFKN